MKKSLLLVLLLNLLFLVGCGADNELSGFWLSSDGATLNFISGNRVCIGQYGQDEIDNDIYKYEIADDVVTLTLEDSPESNPFTLTYSYNIEDDILTLSGKDFSVSYYGSDYMQEEIMVGLSISNR